MKTAFVVLAALAISCSSSKTETPATTSLDVTINTGEFEIAPGDTFECFYTDVHTPNTEVGITGALGKQGPGGHHITVYYTDLEHPVGHHACSDSEMVQWRQVAGADAIDTGPDAQFQLPAGMAYKVPPGKQILLQSHYINATGKPMKVTSEVTVKIVAPETVKTWVNQYQSSFEAFSIPPKGTAKGGQTCTINEDINVFLLTGHMHEWGKHYKLETVDAAGNSLETIYEHDWEPSFFSHPPLGKWDPAKPWVIKKGTKLRQTCEWQNDTADEIIFPREMCVFFGYYFPDKGTVWCEKDPT
jgi:hypothetical protein